MENTSGQGKLAVVPAEIHGWNWGAFFLNWIWGIGNKTYIALLSLVPLVNFVMMFILGARGNEWAWQNRRWDSIEQFQKVQGKWTAWGFGVFLTIFGITLASIVINVAMTIAKAPCPCC
jgi:hypothetical protein